MPPAEPSKVARCPSCNARQVPGDLQCWLCGAKASVAALAGSRPDTSSPSLPDVAQTAGRFSLATLMLFMTLAAIVCGVIGIAPGLGIFLAIVLIPILAHTFILSSREESRGHALRPGQMIQLFLMSVAVVCMTGLAASIAFGVTCFAGFWAGAAAGSAVGATGYDPLGWGFVVGIGLGCIGSAIRRLSRAQCDRT